MALKHHTSSPWIIRGETDNVTDFNYARGIEPTTGRNDGGWPYFIRQDNDDPCPLWLAGGIQDIEVARLLAAAPDLLAAMIDLLREVDNCVEDGTLNANIVAERTTAARAAIAKATGE
jgi:hypothetical protein